MNIGPPEGGKPVLTYADPETNSATLRAGTSKGRSTRRPLRPWQWLSVLIAVLFTFAVLFYKFLDAFDRPDQTPPFTVFDIKNATGGTIDDVTFYGPDGLHDLGPLAAGKTASIRLETRINFEYRYTVTAGGDSERGNIAFGDADARGPFPHLNVTINSDKYGLRVKY